MHIITSLGTSRKVKLARTSKDTMFALKVDALTASPNRHGAACMGLRQHGNVLESHAES